MNAFGRELIFDITLLVTVISVGSLIASAFLLEKICRILEQSQQELVEIKKALNRNK